MQQKGLDKNGNPSNAIGLIHSGKHPNVYAEEVNFLIVQTKVDPQNIPQSKINLEKTLDGIRQKLINAQLNGKTWYNVMK